MRVRARWVLLGAAAALLAACGPAARAPAGAPVSATATTEPATRPLQADDVVTYRGDYARTGWYRRETELTADVVGRMAPLWQSPPLAGTIYAQPLVAAGVTAGGARRDLVLVVTSADRLYAFDAATGQTVWGPVAIGQPVPRSLLACGDVDPVGITSTPVLDPASGTLYAVGLVRNGAAGMRYLLAAIDVATGAERPGYPVTIAPPATNGLSFDVRYQQQRAALTLLAGTVYVPFGGYFGDCGDYHGWVVAIPTADPAAQQAFVVPTRAGGGIWSAAGLSADAAGNLYAATGNSIADTAVDYGDAVVRLPAAGRLAAVPADFFAPSDFARLNAEDADLGSATPVVLPAQSGSATPNLLFVLGKPGVAYLLDRDRLGGVGGQVYQTCLFGPCPGQRHGSFATAAYWDGAAAGSFVFAAGDGTQPAPCRGQGGVVALRLGVDPQTGRSNLAVAWCSAGMGDPGSPAVTGPAGGAAVVWVIDTQAGVLHALAARDGQELWSARLGPVQRFIAPAVAGGRVFVGARDRVLAFAAP